MGVLLALNIACSKPEGYDAYRERTAQYGNRHLQNEQGLFHQRKGEHALALRWYIAAGTPTNHIVKSKETAVDIVSHYDVFLKVIKNDPGNHSVDFGNLKADTKIIIPGLPTAMYNAGATYEKHYQKLGMENEQQALREAVKWYKLGAEGGLELAQFSYGYALEFGLGGETKNLKEAGNWYEQSAKQGVSVAQENFANLYFNGFGEPDKPDYSNAYLWYSIAAKTLLAEGGEPSKDLSNAIHACRRFLSKDESSRVDRLAAAFKPQVN
jgi:hypothetical protein|tara:strand:+ start:1883 stop:2686 length:804 start_codon:yes stop_codon:yes gene_type:complete